MLKLLHVFSSYCFIRDHNIFLMTFTHQTRGQGREDIYLHVGTRSMYLRGLIPILILNSNPIEVSRKSTFLKTLEFQKFFHVFHGNKK